jgi:hypothetical protein
MRIASDEPGEARCRRDALEEASEVYEDGHPATWLRAALARAKDRSIISAEPVE